MKLEIKIGIYVGYYSLLNKSTSEVKPYINYGTNLNIVNTEMSWFKLRVAIETNLEKDPEKLWKDLEFWQKTLLYFY